LNLEATSTDAYSILAQFLMKVRNQQSKFTICDDQPYTVNINIPPRIDLLNETKSDEIIMA
jgi:hypothetical protein